MFHQNALVLVHEALIELLISVYFHRCSVVFILYISLFLFQQAYLILLFFNMVFKSCDDFLLMGNIFIHDSLFIFIGAD